MRRPVQLVRRHVVAEQVPAVVGEPQLAGPGVPVEAHGVAHAARERLEPRAVRPHAQDGRVPVVGRLADVARRADRHVQHPVGAEPDELPAVVAILRERGVHHHGPRRRCELFLDPVEPEHPAHLCHEERPVAERDTVGLVEAPGDHPRLVGAAVGVEVPQRVHHALPPGADEQGASIAQGERPGAGNVPGEQADRESRRQADALEREIGSAGSHDGEHREEKQRKAFHPGLLSAPRSRRPTSPTGRRGCPRPRAGPGTRARVAAAVRSR